MSCWKYFSRCRVLTALILIASSIYIISLGLHQQHFFDSNSIPNHEKEKTLPLLHSSRNNNIIYQLPIVENPHPVKQEVRHIGFLKVHKAASSTMQNMFFRFGLVRNLTFVFTRHPNYFSRTSYNHIPLVEPKYRTSYDILCNHGIFNFNIYSSLLPKDTVYIAIVRDPLAVFVSAVNYYSQRSQLIDYIGRVPGNKLQNLIQHPERYDRSFFSYTKNVMARDFGFPETTENNRVSSYLDELDSILTFVIIVEHFEESLVLMKRYLNWNLKDILFISNNVYGKGGSVNDLTPKDVEVFKKRNSLDYILYNFFYKKFKRQLNDEDEDIHDEILHFKSMLTSLQTFCSSGKIGKNEFLEFSKSKWNEHITMHQTDCDLMKKDEQDFIKILRKKQGSELS